MNRRDFLQVAGVAGAAGAVSEAIGATMPVLVPPHKDGSSAATASTGEPDMGLDCSADADAACTAELDGDVTRYSWCRFASGESSVFAFFYGGHRDFAAIPKWLDAQEKWLFEQENTWPTIAELEHAEQRSIARSRSVRDRIVQNRPLPSLGPRDTVIALIDDDLTELIDPCAAQIQWARARGAATVLVLPEDSLARQLLEERFLFTGLLEPRFQIVTFRRPSYRNVQAYGERAMESVLRLMMADQSTQERWFEIRPERRVHRRGFETRKYVHKIDTSTAVSHVQRIFRGLNYYGHHVDASPSNEGSDRSNPLRLWSLIGRMDEWQGPLWDDASLVLLTWGEDLVSSANLDALITFRESLPPQSNLLVRMHDGHQGSLLVFNGERLFEE